MESSLDVEDAGETETISAQSLYATLGLSPEDVDALAEIPESEISVETLPYLIMKLKAKRANKTMDTDHRSKPDTPERRRSPLSSRRSGSRDRHGKGEGSRYTGGRRDSRHSSSREKQSGDDVAEERDDGEPTTFPHECVLCKCVTNSKKTWNEHVLGHRHKSRESKSFSRSSRSSQPLKRPHSSNPSVDTSMSTSSDHLYPHKPNTKVVVFKFPMAAVSVEELLELSKPFGTVVKHLVFTTKGFLEFNSHKEAQNMVSHFQTKPAIIRETRVIMYLSPTVDGIHSPPWLEEPLAKRSKRPNVPSVVCISRLPPVDVEAEVLELAEMFGEVRQSRFTGYKALIEMVDWKDADIMVKYYYSNPLRIQGRSVKVYMSHIKSLRENSPEHQSRKADSSTKQRDESSNKTEKSNVTEKNAEEMLEDEVGIHLEDEPGLLDSTTDDVMTPTEEEEEPVATEEEENREKVSDEHPEEQDDWEENAEFPENIEDFVTLDELDSTADSNLQQDGKVVVVWPVRKNPDLFEDLTSLCAPFGTIVKHAVSVYRKEAVIELETSEKARDMVQFYREHKAKLFGRPVSVYMSLNMKTIESPSGRSVFISCLPTKRPAQTRYTHISLFELAQPFGTLTGYFLNKKLGTCYIQFETAEAAEKMVLQYARRPCIFWGSVLKISFCRKGDSLIRWKEVPPIYTKMNVKEPGQSTDRTEKDQANKSDTNENDQNAVPDCEGVCGDPVCEDKDAEDVDQKDRTPLGPYQPDHTVGVDYVIPVMGFFCKLCNVFYSDENRAKSEHCKSLEHYNNLKIKYGESVEQTDEPTED